MPRTVVFGWRCSNLLKWGMYFTQVTTRCGMALLREEVAKSGRILGVLFDRDSKSASLKSMSADHKILCVPE